MSDSRPTQAGVEIVPITGELIRQVVEVHLRAFQDNYTGRLGRRYATEFIRWFTRQENTVGLAAVDDSGVMGYVIGTSSSYHAINRDLFWTVLASVILRPRLWFDRGFRRALLTRFKVAIVGNGVPGVPQEAGGGFGSLVGIGVSPRARGRNVGRRLVAAFENWAAERNVRLLRLSVYGNNEVACRLYEKCGWELRERGNNGIVYYFKLPPAKAGNQP